MRGPRVVVWGAVSLTAGGALWTLLGVGALSGVLGAIPGREDVVMFVLSLSLTAAGLLGVHAAQGGATGALGRLGLTLALLAIAVRAAGGIAYLAGTLALERVSPPGTAVMLIGLLLYGLATLRAGVLPRWYGAALALAMPVSFLPPSAYGTTIFGLTLTVLGLYLVLWSRRGGGSAPPSPRVV